MTHYDAVRLVLGVLRDGSRNDRLLRVTGDGDYYTTPDRTYLTADGPQTPPYVEIPVASDCTEAEEEGWADALVRELDREVAAAE